MAEVVIDGYGPLSRSSVVALEYAAKVIAEDHALNNGQTALFWHLVSVSAKHISNKEVQVSNG